MERTAWIVVRPLGRHQQLGVHLRPVQHPQQILRHADLMDDRGRHQAVGDHARHRRVAPRPRVQLGDPAHEQADPVERAVVQEPEHRQPPLLDQAPEGVEGGIVERAVDLHDRQRLDAEVQAAHAQLVEAGPQPRQPARVVGRRLPDLRQRDEAARVARGRLGVVLVEIAVDVIGLQDADVDARQVHLAHHPFGRRLVVGEARRVDLHAIADSVDRDFRLSMVGEVKAHVRHVGNGVGAELQQRVGDVLAGVRAPEVDPFARVVLPELEPQRGRDSLRLRSEPRKDVVVRVDDRRVARGARQHPAAARPARRRLFAHAFGSSGCA